MKKSLISLIVATLLITITGCELVRKVPNNKTNTDINSEKESITERVEKNRLNPSDHIFDVDLEKIKKDLDKKSIDMDDNEWILSSESIISSEFGGADLHDGKLRSLYHLILKKVDVEDKYELGLYLNYKWNGKTWDYQKLEQVYLETLAEDVNNLGYEKRQELKEKYDTRPPDNKPDIVDETDEGSAEGEITGETDTAEGEITGGEEIVEEEIISEEGTTATEEITPVEEEGETATTTVAEEIKTPVEGEGEEATAPTE